MAATEPAELRVPDAQHDWSTLAARAVDDIGRMVQAELHLAEANFRASLKEILVDAFAMLAVAGFIAAAAACLLAALIVLLHHWVEWWLAFAIAGAISLTIGAVISFIPRLPKKSLQRI